MCGIVGIISKKATGFYHQDADMLENLMTLDYIRGKHSSGVFGVHTSNQVSMAKIASHPLDLFACKDWTGFRNKMAKSMHMVIGHNRRATGGKITSENAHPYAENNIILVHNGVIHSGVKTENKDIDVDSHMVCEAFAKSNYEEVVKSIRGAFAFVWYDTNTKTLHTLRNDERPMHIIDTDDHYYLASEPWMVVGLLGRETGEKYKVRSIVSTEVGQLYSFQKNKPYTKVAVELAKETTYENYGTGGRWLQEGEGVVRQLPLSTPGRAVPQTLTTTMNSENITDVGGVIAFPTSGRNSREDFYKELHAARDGLMPPTVGQEVIFYLTTIKSTNTKDTVRITGVVCSSAHAKTDVSFSTSDSDVYFDNDKMYHFQGIIKNVVWLQGGPVVELRDVKPVVNVAVHQAVIPLIEWRFLSVRGKCKECETNIQYSHQLSTKVRWNRPNKGWDCICPQCISKKIQSPLVKAEFDRKAGIINDTSNSSVQDGVAGSDLALVPIAAAVAETGKETSQLH